MLNLACLLNKSPSRARAKRIAGIQGELLDTPAFNDDATASLPEVADVTTL